MDHRPVDQATRDAIRGVLDRNFFVEAGAGTGKTTVLVDRIVAILRSGYATVDELVVITFTRLAAAELATRIRERLEAARADAATGEERARLDEALAALPRARIETIHAFAAGLLRERPVEAGLDPGFEELDELSASLAFDEAYQEWLGQLLQGRPEPVWRALNRGLELKHLREIVEHVHQHRSLLPLAPDAAAAPDVAGFLDRFEQDVAELEALLGRCRNPDDHGARQIRALLARRDELRAARDDPDALERVILHLPKIAQKGARGNWADPADCDRQKEICAELNAALDDLKQALRADAVAGLVPLAEAFVRDYAARRRATGRAEFDDLLIWARDLLRDRPEVRRYFRERFRCILVDEFQDTDPLQVEILLYLCGEPPAGADGADWRALRPEPGRLFLVGDPKQSIYRFRRADLSVYDWVKRHVLPDALCTITQNFRSLAGVIDWVNAVFAQVITPLDGVQAGYVALHAWPQARLDLPRAPVVVVHDQVVGSADDVRRHEAAALVALIQQAVDGAQGWPVRDPGTGAVRPARWRDIAVLTPSRSGIERYEEVLAEAGIPYRHEGGRAFFRRQEVRELIHCLRAIDDPGDRLSLVAALRSGAFGCSDEEIFLAADALRGQLDYRVEPPAGHAAVADGLRTLRALAALRPRLPLPELVRAVLDETRLVEYALTLPQGEQAAANLLKVVDQARAFAAARGGGLRAFVRWLASVSDEERDSQEADADVAEAGDDVVRLLTIHAAKGLEFPIVALVNLQGRSPKSRPAIPDYAARRLHLRVGKQGGYFETPGFAEAAEREQQHDAAEHDRLLYVAATRARDHLILPVILGCGAREKEHKPKGMLARLAPHLPAPQDGHPAAGADVDGCHLLAGVPASVRAAPEPASPPPAGDVETLLSARTQWQEERAALLARAGAGLRVTTASSVEAWGQHDAPNGEEPREHLPRAAALAVGTALHAVMETLDLSGDGTIEATAKAMAAEAGVPDRAAEVAALARACLASDVVQRARAADRAAREVPFTLAVGDGFVEGRVDLLFREPDGLVLADYKTDAVAPEHIDARLAVYRNQAAVYAFAIARITGLPVKEVVFVFARAGVERAIPVDPALLTLGERLAASGAALTDEAL
ncbi:MAG: UvrD-helicase domain-containing protein [Sphaerobacter sp.]|nr:UvrD-helicase domain-containing protein [Sphaerobacter sp.]